MWNSPTIDTKRHALYIGTGDAYTSPAAPTTDSIMAHGPRHRQDFMVGAGHAERYLAGRLHRRREGDAGELPERSRSGSRFRLARRCSRRWPGAIF